MISWKLPGLCTISLVASSLALGILAPQVVAADDKVDSLAQSVSPAEHPWADSQSEPGSYSSGNFQSPQGNFQSPQGSYQSPQGSYQPQAYSAPAGGYSSPYGYAPTGNFSANFNSQQNAPAPFYEQPSAGLISSHANASVLPDGLVLPCQLDSSIDTNKVEEGDSVQVHITQNISSSGVGYLPGGSQFAGTVVKAPDEGHFGRSGKFGIEFTQVRFPTGTLIPLRAHLVGRIGTYIYRPEGSASGNLMNSAWRNGLGSGMGRGLGTMMSVGSDGGYGPGNGAYVGAFMAGTSQILNSIFLRRHHDVFLHPGTKMQLQLDGPLNLPGFNNRQNLPGTGPNTGIFLCVADLQAAKSIEEGIDQLAQVQKNEWLKAHRKANERSCLKIGKNSVKDGAQI